MGIENPLHLLFIAAVALIVLGPKRLPELAKALGQGIREFRESLSEGEEETITPAHDAAADEPPLEAEPEHADEPRAAAAATAPPEAPEG
ncbi:MAG TPA: twin-arginine translocase TatA/TatE family subunit [Solirubrobacteraceae bacterium]